MPSEHNNDLDSAPEENVRQISEDPGAFNLQPDPVEHDTSSLLDLLRFHDRVFIENAYSVIAQRDPSASELAAMLAVLRNGDKSKLEIIEDLVADQKKSGGAVVVNGLPSTTLRKLGKWPVVGPFFRILRGVTRLPRMMEDQQRFESYAIAQQQRIADFLNERVVPAVNLRKINNVEELQGTLADVVDSISLLSDSVVEVAMKQNELAEAVAKSETQFKKFSDQAVQISTQISTQLITVEAAQRQLQAQTEQLAREPRQLQEQITSLGKQRETTETLFRDDLLHLTEAIQNLQSQFEGFVSQLSSLETQAVENAASQREFLIQEQRLIVETQKVALDELHTQITETEERTQAALNSLSDVVQRIGTTDPTGTQT